MPAALIEGAGIRFFANMILPIESLYLEKVTVKMKIV
jgi:hypothetical protein